MARSSGTAPEIDVDLNDKTTSSAKRRRRLFTVDRVAVIVLGAAGFGLGCLGLYQYSRTEAGAQFGQTPTDIAYHAFQLFFFGSQPLEEGRPPFNVWLEIGRYAAAAATVFAILVAATTLLQAAWRRRRIRRTRGHAIVVGTTTEAADVAAALVRQGVKVRRAADGDIESLRAAGLRGAASVYALGYDEKDRAVNVATALAAAAHRPGKDRKGRDLNVLAHIPDPNLALALQARRIALSEQDGPFVDFVNIDELAASGHVVTLRPDVDHEAHIVVAGATSFGRAVIVEFARRWALHARTGGPTVRVSLIDPQPGAAASAARELSARWPAVDRWCDITTYESDVDTVLLAGIGPRPYRSYFCDENEESALRGALTAVSLWHGGSGSVVVRLNTLARHGKAFGEVPDESAVRAEDRQPLLDSIDGRLVVVDVAEAAGSILPHRSPELWLERLAESVHEAFLLEQIHRGVTMGDPKHPAMKEWKDLSADLKQSNRNQVRDFPTKLRQVKATVAPRSALAPLFVFRDGEVEELAMEEHDRWMKDRAAAGYIYGPVRNDKSKPPTHPLMVPWADLGEHQEKDRDAVRSLVTIFEPVLADRGLQIVRLGD